MTTIGLPQLLDAIESDARRAGGIAGLTRHEPDGPPAGEGMRLSVWLQGIQPARGASGLNITAARVELALRVYARLTKLSQDRVDRDVAAVVDGLYAAYSGDFELDGHAMQVDIFGAHGQGMTGSAGYQTIDGETFRVFTLTLPIILADVWEQTP